MSELATVKVDVIIPTYNRASSLKRSIDSVLNQSYRQFRIYIVDDGSTDETATLLRTYEQNPLIVILNQKNSGVSAARNLGINSSTNKWIAFLDSDDEWLPEKLKEQVQYLLQNPSCRFLHTEEIWMRKNQRVNPPHKYKKSNENIFLRSLHFCLISPSSVLIDRNLFLECGLFNEALVVCEDYDLWLRILLKESVAFLNKNLVIKYGGASDQLSTRFNDMDYWRVKSLISLYADDKLSHEQKNAIKNVLLIKSEILLKAYRKYQNVKRYEEVKKILTSLS